MPIHNWQRYKDSSLKTMMHRAYTLSFTTKAVNAIVSNCALFSVVLTTLWALLIPLLVILFLEMLRQAQRKDSPYIVACFCEQKNFGKMLNPKKSSRQLWIGNALFIVSYVICAMQIMSGSQPDILINALLSTNIQ